MFQSPSETQRCFPLKAVGFLGFAVSVYQKRVLASYGLGIN